MTGKFGSQAGLFMNLFQDLKGLLLSVNLFFHFLINYRAFPLIILKEICPSIISF